MSWIRRNVSVVTLAIMILGGAATVGAFAGRVGQVETDVEGLLDDARRATTERERLKADVRVVGQRLEGAIERLDSAIDRLERAVDGLWSPK